jgi:type II secretory pathway pseudopilin PulG
MKMWAFFQEQPRLRDRALRFSSGFTLLEMLVIIFIVGVVSAVALPRLPLMADSLDFALKRQSFEQELSGLAYRAYTDKQDFVLAGYYDSTGRDSDQEVLGSAQGAIRADLRTRPVSGQSRELLPPVIIVADIAPSLPEGWELVVSEPIFFHGSGYCSGGGAELFVGRQRYSYVLAAPSCKAVLAN